MVSQGRSAISIRISNSVLDWFRSEHPKGYQTAVQLVLEEHVRRATEKRDRACGRAQEIFRSWYAQCFWHYDKDLQITPQNLFLVIDGLRKYGGQEGLILAEDLCR